MAIMQGLNAFCQDIHEVKGRITMARASRRREAERERDRMVAERFQAKREEHGTTPLKCVRDKAQLRRVMAELRMTDNGNK